MALASSPTCTTNHSTVQPNELYHKQRAPHLCRKSNAGPVVFWRSLLRSSCDSSEQSSASCIPTKSQAGWSAKTRLHHSFHPPPFIMGHCWQRPDGVCNQSVEYQRWLRQFSLYNIYHSLQLRHGAGHGTASRGSKLAVMALPRCGMAGLWVWRWYNVVVRRGCGAMSDVRVV